MYRHLAFLVSIIVVLLISPIAHAQWVVNGVPVSTATADQVSPKAASDGAGGTIVVWEDNRTGNANIYAQRIDAHGNAMWLADGIPIRTDASADLDPVIASDGAGGAIIAWESLAGAQRVGMQRVDANGNVLWTVGGVTIHNQLANSGDIEIISDGAGGGIVAWVDFRNGRWSPFVQRVDAGGTVMWTSGGVLLCNAAVGQLDTRLVSDGAGGAIVVWEDIRNASHYDVYTQRVNASGTPQWTVDGVAICTAVGDQQNPVLTADGQGGAIIAWADPRAGGANIFTQRIGFSGSVVWTVDGVQTTTVSNTIGDVGVVSDGSLGAIIVWRDNRNANNDVFAQRVNNAGAFQWTLNGEVVCVNSSSQYSLRPIEDGAGGVIVSWTDLRNLVGEDVYVQRMDASGAPVWATDGVVVSTATGDQGNSALCTDGAGGAIVAFSSGTTPNIDVYAQRVERNGYWGYPSANVVSANDVASDQGGLVSLEWDASRLDPFPEEKIDNYTLWRAITLPSAAALLDQGVPLIDMSDIPHTKMKSAIRAEASAAGSSYWELIDSQDAYGLSTYSKLVSTTGDSTSVSPSLNYFQVIAHDAFASQAWISNSVGGYSLDNLSPAAPLLLIANRVGDDVQLDWNASGALEVDFSHYAVYRKESSGVDPVLINFLSSAADTTLLDEDADPGTQYFYVVTAVDEHENESEVSNEVVANIVTSVGGTENTPAFSTLTLLNNMPNPFGDAGTTIRFGMPEAADVSVEFYDIAGRRVATRRVAGASVGENSLRFNGLGDNGLALPSGIYFYRVSGAGGTAVGKLSIVR